MDKLENAEFTDLAIEAAAVRARPDFAALLIDPLAYLCSSKVIEKRAPQFFEIGATIGFFEEDSSAILIALLAD